VPAQGEVTLRITIGDDIAKADREGRIEWIYVQTVSSDCSKYDNYTLKMNTVDLARQYDIDASAQKPETALLFPEPGRLAPLPPLENIRRHRVRHIDLHRGVNYLTIKSYGDPMTITDVELGIKYR
jgi:hypothetical protein